MRRHSGVLFFSSFSHVLSHKTVFGLLLAMMSLIFYVQLLLSGVFQSLNQEHSSLAEWEMQTYSSFNLSLDSAEVEGALRGLLPWRDRILDICILGELSEDTYTKQGGMPEMRNLISLIAFYPSVSPDRMLDEKGLLFDDPDDTIYMDENWSIFYIAPEKRSVEGGADLSGQKDEREIFDTVYRINGRLWTSKGSASFKYPVPGSHSFVLSSYANFFELTDQCTRIYVHFDQPLSASELARLNQKIAQETDFNVSFFPLPDDEQDLEFMGVFFTQYMTLAALIFLLVISALSLFDYLLILRKTEFQVYLLCGSTIKSIWQCALFELILCWAIATGLGTIWTLLPFSRILLSEEIRAKIIPFLCGNALLFLGVLLLGFIVRMKFFRLEQKFLFAERGSK